MAFASLFLRSTHIQNLKHGKIFACPEIPSVPGVVDFVAFGMLAQNLVQTVTTMATLMTAWSLG